MKDVIFYLILEISPNDGYVVKLLYGFTVPLITGDDHHHHYYYHFFIFFQDYLGFKTEVDRREPLYLKIGEKVLSGRSLKITRADWEKLDIRWQEVDELVSEIQD